MTNKLYEETAVQAIANAIRAKTGKTTDLKIGEMVAEIDGIIPCGEVEVWLHGPRQRNGQLFIDTGVAASDNHTIEIVGYGNIYSSSTLFGAVTSGSSRQVLNLLTSSNKLRLAWGNSGLKTFEFTIEEWTPWLPFTLRFNKNGYTLRGYNNSYTAATHTGNYGATPSGASAANYKVFPHLSSANGGGELGVFRRARIYNGSELLHEFVPKLRGDFRLYLEDKITGNSVAIPFGENGYGAQWEPHTDALMDGELALPAP